MGVGRELESFEDVRTLTESELQDLLSHGRPEQRVWAIWALALRSTAAVAELGARNEPDAGVRRNLAVVLAGHGQLDLLVALAKRDPAPEVRAAAMQLIARFAIDGKLPETLVVERATTDTADVKIAVLGTMFSGAPAWLGDLGEKLLEDRDGDVRYEAFEALMRLGRDGAAMMWLEESPEAETRLALMRWSARGRVRACAEALANASRRLRRLLVESVRTVSWKELSPAIGDDIALVRALSRRNPTMFEEMPLPALMRTTLREPTAAWIGLVRDRLAKLETPGDDVDGELLHEFREQCARQIGECDAAIKALKKHRDEELDHEISLLEDQRVVLESALEHASRLLVH